VTHASDPVREADLQALRYACQERDYWRGEEEALRAGIEALIASTDETGRDTVQVEHLRAIITQAPDQATSARPPVSLFLCNFCRDDPTAGDFVVPADKVGVALLTEHFWAKHGVSLYL
jgi:hypothetical protein